MTTTLDSGMTATPPRPAVDTEQLRLDTDRCVKCALCLPVCPTYALERTETQSPRGRVALVQALAAAQLDAGEAAPALDSCLACRACEQVCPAQVRYGSILDRGRALMAPDKPDRFNRRIARLLRSPLALRTLAAVHRMSRHLPLQGTLARWRAMPAPPTALAVATSTNARGRVALMLGCVTHAFERDVNDALALLLRRVGYQVDLIHGCCGALSAHGGDLDAARAASVPLMRATTGEHPIVHAASGCGAALHDVGDWHGSVEAATFSQRVTDPFVLLRDAGIKDHLQSVAKHKAAVAVHLPCTQRNVLKGGDALTDIMTSLLAVEVEVLSGHGCCGAAGTHMLSQPDKAQKLVDAVLAPLVDRLHPPLLLSANIGCAWHLRARLHEREQPISVLHPAVYLAKRLSTVAATN